MTRDEVMALTDDELQLRIAKVRGYTVEWRCEENDGPRGGADERRCVLRDKDGHVIAWEYREEDLRRHMPGHIPDYPRDIAAAWPLAVELGLTVIPCDDGRWFAVKDGFRFGPAYKYFMDVCPEDCEEGVCAAQAICRTYLWEKEVAK